jgi:hypothetical protein
MGIRNSERHAGEIAAGRCGWTAVHGKRLGLYALDPKRAAHIGHLKQRPASARQFLWGRDYFADTKKPMRMPWIEPPARSQGSKGRRSCVREIHRALTLYDGRLRDGVGVGEETSATRPDYACRTFRGSVSALDAATGEVI